MLGHPGGAVQPPAAARRWRRLRCAAVGEDPGLERCEVCALGEDRALANDEPARCVWSCQPRDHDPGSCRLPWSCRCQRSLRWRSRSAAMQDHWPMSAEMPTSVAATCEAACLTRGRARSPSARVDRPRRARYWAGTSTGAGLSAATTGRATVRIAPHPRASAISRASRSAVEIRGAGAGSARGAAPPWIRRSAGRSPGARDAPQRPQASSWTPIGAPHDSQAPGACRWGMTQAASAHSPTAERTRRVAVAIADTSLLF